MTRKEWIEKNLPAYINENADGGVIGCPRSYRELVRIDPSVLTNNPCKGCHALSSFHVCTECWNQEIPGTKKTRPNGFRLEKVEKAVKEADLSIKEAIDRATCDCDTCAHQDLCRFECQFRGMTKEMYLHCIEETARYNIPELGIQMRPLHCKRYEPSPAIKDLNTAVFHLQAQHLTDEMVRKIFDEENKQWTL